MNAGLKLFAEKGFHGTTVPEIATLAAVGAGTFYRYFLNKEALVNELFQYWKQEYVGALLGNLPPFTAPRSLFHEIWTRLHIFASHKPEVLDFLELHRHRSYLDDESRHVERSVNDKMTLFIETAQNAQVVRHLTPAVLVSMVWGAFYALFRAGSDGYIELTPKIYDEAEEAVWAAIRV